jgi:cell division protein FtsQ
VWPRILWITLTLAGLAGFCLGLILLYYHLLTCSTFCIKDDKNIEIIGNQRLSRAQVLELAKLDSHTNLLALRPTAVEQTLQAHPWIAKAELERRWPNRLALRLTERRPLALVQLEELYYTDLSGSLFKPASTDPHDFPVITGLTREHFPDEQRPPSALVVQVLKLLALFQEAPEPVTSSRVAEIHVDPERGFTLYLSGLKTALDLGFTDLPEKIKKLPQVWPFLVQRGYLARTGRINFDHPQRLLLSLKGMEETN